jgi:16S rRNA (guanine966-N2)-methyltransferase
VIAGRLGGRTLVAPAGAATRPTSDRVREALFSILGDVRDADVLDLYAGTGALGIEALSRGASSATFVERARAALRALELNIELLDIGPRAKSCQWPWNEPSLPWFGEPTRSM